MALSYAVYQPIDPIAGLFRHAADRRLQPHGVLPDEAEENERARGVGGVDRFDLDPPSDSLQARIGIIGRLLRRGDPVAALDRAAILMRDHASLPPEMAHTLRYQASAGIEQLKIMGLAGLARDYTQRLLPDLLVQPAAPRLEYADPRPRSPSPFH